MLIYAISTTIKSISSDGSYIEAPTVSHIVDLLRVSWFFKLVEEKREIKWDLRKQGQIFLIVFLPLDGAKSYKQGL